jgi:hypothetical protein
MLRPRRERVCIVKVDSCDSLSECALPPWLLFVFDDVRQLCCPFQVLCSRLIPLTSTSVELLEKMLNISSWLAAVKIRLSLPGHKMWLKDRLGASVMEIL